MFRVAWRKDGGRKTKKKMHIFFLPSCPFEVVLISLLSIKDALSHFRSEQCNRDFEGCFDDFVDVLAAPASAHPEAAGADECR